MLLDGAQGFGRSGVAGEDDEGASAIEEVTDGLKGELIDDLEGAGTIGGTSIIAQVEVVVLGHELAYLPEDGQTAITAVKDTNGTDSRLL